jgi:hypothetical protein
MWTVPLTQSEIDNLLTVNQRNGPMEIVDGPIGPMVILRLTHGQFSGTIFYCGGNCYEWLEEARFFSLYPQYKHSHQYMTAPEFDLDDMELAEMLIEEMKCDTG